MSIEAQRPIPFGEQMTEKHCKLLGHIGQISIMAEFGRILHEKQGTIPGSSPETAVIRSLCQSLHRGRFLEVARQLDAHTATSTREAEIANRLGLLQRDVRRGHDTLSGPARTAFRFHAGESPLTIPDEFEPSFRDVVTFYTQRTFEEITLRAKNSPSDRNAAVEPLARSRSDITYEVRYLEPRLDDSLAG